MGQGCLDNQDVVYRGMLSSDLDNLFGAVILCKQAPHCAFVTSDLMQVIVCQAMSADHGSKRANIKTLDSIHFEFQVVSVSSAVWDTLWTSDAFRQAKAGSTVKSNL